MNMLTWNKPSNEILESDNYTSARQAFGIFGKFSRSTDVLLFYEDLCFIIMTEKAIYSSARDKFSVCFHDYDTPPNTC